MALVASGGLLRNKKGNLAITQNQNLQDVDGVAIVGDGNTYEVSDQGAIAAAERISRDAINASDRATQEAFFTAQELSADAIAGAVDLGADAFANARDLGELVAQVNEGSLAAVSEANQAAMSYAVNATRSDQTELVKALGKYATIAASVLTIAYMWGRV